MKVNASLTRRESQIAELIAWGAAKKEIALQLFISERTVENTARHIYEKTEVTKAAELSAWWFCKTFNIAFTLSPLKRQIVAVAMLLLIISNEVFTGETIRIFRSRTKTEIRVLRSRRDDNSFEYLLDL